MHNTRIKNVARRICFSATNQISIKIYTYNEKLRSINVVRDISRKFKFAGFYFKLLRLFCARILNDFSNGLSCQTFYNKYCIDTVYNHILVSGDGLIWTCASIVGRILDTGTCAWMRSIARQVHLNVLTII